jgi:hypothetical protein
LRNHPEVAEDLDANLKSQELTDKTASVNLHPRLIFKLTPNRFTAFLQSTATPIVDLSLYVSAENYNTTTSSAYTAMLPWFANYTVPPKRRDLARARTAHMGLSSLDVDTTAEEGFAPGRGTASSEYEAAKRAAGIPTDKKPNILRMGSGKGIGGFLSTPVYAARFRLDALSNELLEPLADLLGKNDYLFEGGQLTSLDCLAFGYLSLLYYPAVPQAWLKETIQTKFPRIASYIRRLRKEIFSTEEISSRDIWLIPSGSSGAAAGMLLPWQPRTQSFASKALCGGREIFGNIPVVSPLLQRSSMVYSEQSSSSSSFRSFINTFLSATAAAAVGLVALAVHHRRSPRDEALIFWALRSSSSLGEAGNILSILASQMPAGGFSQY